MQWVGVCLLWLGINIANLRVYKTTRWNHSQRTSFKYNQHGTRITFSGFRHQQRQLCMAFFDRTLLPSGHKLAIIQALCIAILCIQTLSLPWIEVHQKDTKATPVRFFSLPEDTHSIVQWTWKLRADRTQWTALRLQTDHRAVYRKALFLRYSSIFICYRKLFECSYLNWL